MKLNQIRDKHGARHDRKVVGRGIGSGLGKTSGRGGKGQTARSGVALNGFEGGQTPLYRRLPKRGFSNHNFGWDFREVNLGALQQAIDAKRIAADQPITIAGLVTAGVVRNARDGLKLLGDGADKFTARIKIECMGVTGSARAAIEKAGGEIVVLPHRRAGVVKDSDAKKAKRAKKLAPQKKGSGGAKAA
jgi:large subunit ribosomal protein L15